MLESMEIPLGVVLGTFGVERHQVTFKGQAAHAGSTPMDKRRDALAGAAKLALEIREIAKRTGEGAVCTMGSVVTKPGIVTSVVETAELPTRPATPRRGELAAMSTEAKEAGGRFAAEEDVDVDWERIWAIEPILFDQDADRARGRGRARGRRRRRTGCRAARSTTPPRWHAQASRR